MTDVNKKNESQKFVAELLAARDKESLLLMARNVLIKSHTKRGYVERDIPESPVALNMKATYAIAGAMRGKELSTDQRLTLIKQRYQKHEFGDFDKDFKKAYPQEYAGKTVASPSLAIQQRLNNMRLYNKDSTI